MPDDKPPINASVPPWGTSIVTGGHVRLHPTDHGDVQHPNPEHVAQTQASPFDGLGAGNWQRGRPRHHPAFGAPRGLAVGRRK